MFDLSPTAILVLAGALIYFAGILGGLLLPWGREKEPRTEADIAEDGEAYLHRSDTSYMHYNREVRS